MSGPHARKLMKVAVSAVILAFASVGAMHVLPYLHACVYPASTVASARYIVVVENATGSAMCIHVVVLNAPFLEGRSNFGSFYEQTHGYRSRLQFTLENGDARVAAFPLHDRVEQPIILVVAFSPYTGFSRADAFAAIPVDLVRGNEHVPPEFTESGRVTGSGFVQIMYEDLVTLPPQGEGGEYGAGVAGTVLREALERATGAE